MLCEEPLDASLHTWFVATAEDGSCTHHVSSGAEVAVASSEASIGLRESFETCFEGLDYAPIITNDAHLGECYETVIGRAVFGLPEAAGVGGNCESVEDSSD